MEEDQLSETWVCWDRQLIDNELYALWGSFQPGVRILVISDSCHSGTVTRELRMLTTQLSLATEHSANAEDRRLVLSTGAAVDLALNLRDGIGAALRDAGGTGVAVGRKEMAEAIGTLLGTGDSMRSADMLEVPRLLDPRDAAQDLASRRELYASEVARTAGAPAPQCSVLLLSGCQDNQTSSDGRPDASGHQNGAFTKALRDEWESAADYADLHARILRRMPATQSPNLYWATPRDSAFEAQQPFTV
jgi:hypothetical protein